MIFFGLAEVITGFTHDFFGIKTSALNAATWLAALIGILYAAAGVLVLTMERRAAASRPFAARRDHPGPRRSGGERALSDRLGTKYSGYHCRHDDRCRLCRVHRPEVAIVQRLRRVGFSTAAIVLT